VHPTRLLCRPLLLALLGAACWIRALNFAGCPAIPTEVPHLATVKARVSRSRESEDTCRGGRSLCAGGEPLLLLWLLLLWHPVNPARLIGPDRETGLLIVLLGGPIG